MSELSKEECSTDRMEEESGAELGKAPSFRQNRVGVGQWAREMGGE